MLIRNPPRSDLSTPLLVVFLLVAAAPAAFANIRLISGTTEVELSSDAFWSIDKITTDGRPVTQYPSGNGIVVQFSDGSWSGEGHGGEALLSATVMVDGVPTPLVDGTDYQGTLISLSRVILLDVSLQVRHSMTVSSNGLDHAISLEGLGARGIQIAYVLAEARVNRFTDVVTREGPTVLASGQTNRNGYDWYRPTIPDHGDTLLQYDPVASEGVLTRWAHGVTLNMAAWVWDRPLDNKLYLVATNYKNAVHSMSLHVSVRFCLGLECLL